MDAVENLKNIEWFYVFLSIVAFFVALKFLIELIKWFLNLLGIETKGMRQRREERELLLKTAENLANLHAKHEEDTKQSIRHDEMIREDLANLTKMFVEKQIDDMRFEILDFASAISLGRNYSKEQFDHVIVIDKKYQQILEDNGLENGQVTASMEVIMDVYKEKLRTGF